MTRQTRSGHQVLARPLSSPRTPSLNLVALMLAAAALGWLLGRSDPVLERRPGCAEGWTCGAKGTSD